MSSEIGWIAGRRKTHLDCACQQVGGGHRGQRRRGSVALSMNTPKSCGDMTGVDAATATIMLAPVRTFRRRMITCFHVIDPISVGVGNAVPAGQLIPVPRRPTGAIRNGQSRLFVAGGERQRRRRLDLPQEGPLGLSNQRYPSVPLAVADKQYFCQTPPWVPLSAALVVGRSTVEAPEVVQVTIPQPWYGSG